MSELKVRFIDDTYVEYYNTGNHDLAQVYIKSEADKVIAELLAREDVLVTDNRNLLDKVKMLEERLHENAEHFKRNESQIIGSSDNVIKKLKAENERLNNLLNVWNTYKILSNTYKELKFTKRALWVARAKRAIEKIAWFRLWNASISTMNPEDGARQEFDKWRKNLGMFLKKAEEYK